MINVIEGFYADGSMAFLFEVSRFEAQSLQSNKNVQEERNQFWAENVKKEFFIGIIESHKCRNDMLDCIRWQKAIQIANRAMNAQNLTFIKTQSFVKSTASLSLDILSQATTRSETEKRFYWFSMLHILRLLLISK